MIRCAITDGALCGDHAVSGSRSLLLAAQRWAADGIDYVQLREKGLPARDLLALAQSMLAVLRGTEAPDPRHRTCLLINSRADVALAARADGVHLTSHPDELTPAQVRVLFARARLPPPIVSISCHTAADVQRSAAGGVDLILFGPVFEKRVAGELVNQGVGLNALRTACQIARRTPVLAIGGITTKNIQLCLDSGAAGIAAIRLFG